MYNYVRGTVFERIEAKILPEPNSGCWLWMGSIGSHGYGQIGVKSGTTVVHRILYEQKFGCVPTGLELDHKCRVRCCVNPDHLEPVTRRENIRRGVAPVAKQMVQTHCKNGHPFAGNNLAVCKTKYGVERRCRICDRARKNAKYHKDPERHREYTRRYLAKKKERSK